MYIRSFIARIVNAFAFAAEFVAPKLRALASKINPTV